MGQNEVTRSMLDSAFLRGSISGATAASLLQPLDVVKTRQQGFILSASHEANSLPRVSFASAARSVLQQDGVVGFWKGLSPTLVRASLGPGIFFLILDALQERSGRTISPSTAEIFVEGATARAIAGTIMCPLSVVKTRFEYAKRNSDRSVLQTLRKIAREERLPGLFRGTISTLVRDIPASGLYLVLYQGIFQPASRSNFGEIVPPSLLNLSSGLLAGAIATFVTHPADSLKTHVQLNNLGVVEGARTLLKSRGIIGMFSGVASRLVRRPLTMAITWTLFEALKMEEK